MVASLRPAAPTIMPATALSMRWRRLACSSNRRATFSFLPVRALSTSAPALTVPLNSRMNTTLRPSSIATLKASAASGSAFLGARSSLTEVSPGSTPWTGGTSSGDGR